jgi:hypothetical protein
MSTSAASRYVRRPLPNGGYDTDISVTEIDRRFYAALEQVKRQRWRIDPDDLHSCGSSLNRVQALPRWMN